MSTVKTTVTLLEELSERHFRALLPNGKEVIAHRIVMDGLLVPARAYGVGEQVPVELNLYNFSKAQLLDVPQK